MNTDKEDKKKIDSYSRVTGGVIGAGVGLVLVGPVGSVIGAAVGPLASDVLSRSLTRKEKTRIERVFELGIKGIQQNIDCGKQIRTDVDQDVWLMLMEGTLLKAKDTYEEKKIPFIANLLANAPFLTTPIVDLNQSLLYADTLSYRQLCILAVINDNFRNNLNLSERTLHETDSGTPIQQTLYGLYSDINYLNVLGIIGLVYSTDAGAAISSGMSMISPAHLKLQYPGFLMHNSMQLDNIDQRDKDEIISLLKV